MAVEGERYNSGQKRLHKQVEFQLRTGIRKGGGEECRNKGDRAEKRDHAAVLGEGQLMSPCS